MTSFRSGARRVIRPDREHDEFAVEPDQIRVRSSAEAIAYGVRGIVVILSTMIEIRCSIRVATLGSTVIRVSDAWTGSVVSGQTVTDAVASNRSSGTITTGRVWCAAALAVTRRKVDRANVSTSSSTAPNGPAISNGWNDSRWYVSPGTAERAVGPAFRSVKRPQLPALRDDVRRGADVMVRAWGQGLSEVPPGNEEWADPACTP